MATKTVSLPCRITRPHFTFALACVGALAGGAAIAEPQADKIVVTDDGPVSGYKDSGLNIFLGLPYAAPPVGDLRWRPPVRPAHWEKPLQATAFGNSCVQTNTLGVFAAKSATEDCLYLNVFSPSDDDAAPGRGNSHDGGWSGHSRKRPVMVWIHGGGLVDGRSNDYDGSKLASQGDVIVVSFNYRLNVFGFLAQSALDKEGHLAGNYGLMDQQFALQWVQRNIDKFGGDPNNVTIFGESAGGGSVIANLASPKSEGLFHRGIIESGGYAITSIAPNLDLATAETTGQQFATAVGCADQSAKCLRSLSVEAIIANGSSYMNTANFLEDGKILPQTLYTALKTGQFNRVPVVNGSNRDEMAWFTAIVEAATGHVLTAADYPGALASAGYFGGNVAQVLAEYPLSAYASPSLALSAAETDLVMACSGRIVNQLLSHYVPTYGYEFADRTAPIYFPAPSFPVGAAHTLEIQYLFPLYHGSQGTPEPLNAFQQRLSDTMVDYWTTFAKHGDPNSYRTPTWPVYNPQYDRIESLNLPSPTQNGNFATEHHCDFWDALAEPKS